MKKMNKNECKISSEKKYCESCVHLSFMVTLNSKSWHCMLKQVRRIGNIDKTTCEKWEGAKNVK